MIKLNFELILNYNLILFLFKSTKMDMFAAPKEKNFSFPAEMNPDTELT